ncbi:uncharacterized protein LOC130547569 [Triplophysa rosa]|uniref:Uncharacterized protein n=1 Tax=Triplophysa rosa TaxID=992332 RepID=A0A9W7T7B2_TRIRA|nr:uncharacterized protein LOC130547569 [Triplophysa rosa]KAI7791960.1 hypothetical protein IRJ41_017057 [Triplophysa rosa]
MQGYAQRSNRQLLPRYQEPPPPYPQRNSQHSQQQAQFNPQPYSTEQARHCNGQQRVVNNWNAHQAVCSDAFAPAFQQCDGRYGANQTLRQQPPTRHQLHHKPSNVAHNAEGQAPGNPNGNNRFYGQFNIQSNLYVASHQNYRNTETLMMYTSSSQHHAYGTCQQLQPRPDHIYPQHPQQLPGQHSGQQQTAPTSGHTLHYNPAAQNRTTMQRMINNQAQSRTAVGYTSPNSVPLPPSGPHRNISPPSNNVQQSRPELMSNTNPNVLSAQSQNNRSSAGHSTADANVQTCYVNQNAQNQTAPNSEAQLNPTCRPFNLNYYLKSKMYEILRSQKEEQDLKNKSTTTQNQSDVGPANETDQNSHLRQILSEPDLQSAAEPPPKRMNFGQTQTYYLKKLPSKNTSGLQSALPGTHRMAVHEHNSTGNGHGGQKQNEIQYVTDPAECLEAVLAIQKSFQKVHKAVAIVPPISLLNANTEWTDDAYTKTDDSPPLKIDLVWSLAKESDSQSPITTEKNGKPLSEDSSPMVEQDDRMSPESKTTNTADSCVTENSDSFSVNPTAGCVNDCDSSDAAFELSNCPVVTYTLGNLRNLVKSLEMTESSAQRPEKPGGVSNRILDLYWNGDTEYLKKHLKELRKVRSYFDVESVKDDTSVVFASITHEEIKKVTHCEIVTDELCSSFEEYRSSWLNVDGQPADIAKVLSEPLSDYITVSKEASGNVSVPADNLGVNSLKDPEVTPFNVNERAKPDSESPGSIFTPSAGIGRTDTKNKEHSDAENSGVTPLCSVPSEQETFENQGDNMQSHKHLNPNPPADLSPSADTSSEQRDDTTTKESLSQDNLTIGQNESVPNIEQQVHLDSKTLLHDHLPSPDLLPACSGDKPLQLVNAVSDAVKDIEEISTTKPSSNFISIWQVEDISDDSMDGMATHSNYADTMQVENISEDENSDNMEIFTNTTGTLQVENTSEDENSDKTEAITNSTHTLQVENISEDENSDNMEVVTKSTDIRLVEDISNDENSSDDSLLMDVTVLSSEEALTFFQQLEKKSTHSSVDHPKLMASSPNQPNREYNKAKICSSCGINDILTSNSTNVTDSDRELFCPLCWDMAPSLDLEMDPCSPKSNESSDGESEKLEDNCSPSSEMEVLEPVIASTDVHVAEEELTAKPKDDMVGNSVAEQKTPEIERPVEQEIVEIQPDKMKDENSEKISMPKLHSNETDVLGDGAASEKMEDNCGLPSLEMEDMETVIALNAANSAEEELTEKTKDDTVGNSVPEQKVPEIRPDKTKDEKMKIKSKPAFLKCRFKPSSARLTSDDSVLFAPDIVLQKSQPQKNNHKAVSAVSRPGGQIQNCNSANKVNKPSEERPDPHLHAVKTSQNHKDKGREKQPSDSTQFMNKTLHRSTMTPEVHNDNLSEKLTTTEKNKVRFALYGSKNEKLCAGQGRKFSPPTTLTVADASKGLSKNTSQRFPEGRRLSAPATLSADYSDVISAKQKVHNQWSSTFIPTAKKTPPPKSPPKGEPLKKKPLKAHELLKSNMPALKNQMMHRSVLLSSQEISKSVQKH